MVTKTITITEEAYHSIKSLKKENESFSELFIRINSRDNDISKFFGVLKGNPATILSELKQERERFTQSMKRRENVLSRHFNSS